MGTGISLWVPGTWRSIGTYELLIAVGITLVKIERCKRT